MELPERARYLHVDAFKRFSAGNRSLKLLSEYMEDRSRVEMEYSLALEQLAARWSRKLADTLDFEYHDFRSVLREVFTEPTDKAQLHNKVANRIMNEAVMLKKQSKDRFKREAQTAIMEKYNEAMGKQIRFEEKTKKSRKKYYRKKHGLENVQKSMEDFPYRSESSTKYQELQQRKADLSEQATDSYLRYESRLRVETTNRPEFIKEMEQCEAAFNEHEVFRLQSVRDRLIGMLRDLEILKGSERGSCKERLTRLQSKIKDFPIKSAVNAYTGLFVKEHRFPKLEDYQNHSEEQINPSGGAGKRECDPSLYGADSSREVVAGRSSTQHTEQDVFPKRDFKTPTHDPVVAWEPPGSDEGSDGENYDPRGSSARNVPVYEEEDSIYQLTPTASETPEENLDDLTNVRVVAIRAYKGNGPKELSFDVGKMLRAELGKSLLDELS